MYFIIYSAVALQPSKPLELIPVDAGVEDRGALSTSLRSIPLDSRQDLSFERLYKVAGSDDVYVRKAGGLYAIFKQSVYVNTKFGEVPVIPAGTVYSIGEIRVDLLGQIGAIAEPNDSDIRVTNNYIEGSPATNYPYVSEAHRSLSGIGLPRFIDDEPYRRARLASLVLKIVLCDNK
jgi:hypothetical protein